MLQLEVGKYYKNRKGEIKGPIIQNNVGSKDTFPFCIKEYDGSYSTDNYCWTNNGLVWSSCTNEDDLIEEAENKHDPVNHPKHYTSHPSGIECIEVTRHMSFNLGNAVKYLWRNEEKNGVEDLKKAIWYIQDEIDKREK